MKNNCIESRISIDENNHLIIKLNDLDIIFQFSEDTDWFSAKLKSHNCYELLFNELVSLLNETAEEDKMVVINDTIQAEDFQEKYFDGPVHINIPMRTGDEVSEYEDEAFHYVSQIRNGEKTCSDWEYGYWSGVMATLRWVLGDEEKDNLDT